MAPGPGSAVAAFSGTGTARGPNCLLRILPHRRFGWLRSRLDREAFRDWPDRRHGNTALNSRLRFNHPRSRSQDGFGNYRGKKSIAAPGNRLNVQGTIGTITEGTANLLDAVIHPLFKIDVGFTSPELALNIFSGHDLARAANQECQKFKGLR